MSTRPQDTYTMVSNALMENPDVTQSQKRGFGSGLRVSGKVFAMMVKGKLVVKLPPHLIDELLAKGEGEPYVSGGRATRDWIVVESEDGDRWLTLAKEAMSFVSSRS